MPKTKRSSAPHDVSAAELRARVEVVSRALDDVRALLADADPVRDPAGFAEREKKALAILDELPSVLPLGEPLSDAKRAELEEQLEDAPDDETMRKILELAVTVLDDPSTPADVRAELEEQDPRGALARLDHAAILQKAADEARALADEITARSEGAERPDPAFAPKPPKRTLS